MTSNILYFCVWAFLIGGISNHQIMFMFNFNLYKYIIFKCGSMSRFSLFVIKVSIGFTWLILHVNIIHHYLHSPMYVLTWFFLSFLIFLNYGAMPRLFDTYTNIDRSKNTRRYHSEYFILWDLLQVHPCDAQPLLMNYETQTFEYRIN